MVASNSSAAQTPNNVIETLNFFFKHIYLLLLVIFGFLGNIFVLLIFGRRAVRKSIASVGSQMSIYPFLFYMAISDSVYLLILFCLWLSNYVNVLHRPVICQTTLYITYICNFINAYFTVAFTSQRFFAVVKPFRVSDLLSWQRSRRIALIILIVACSIYSYLPFLTGIVNGRCFSFEKFRWFNKIMDIVDCVVVFLIPYLLIITMNGLIVVSLRTPESQVEEILFQRSLQLVKVRQVTRRRASRKMTRFLLTVSSSYLIICGPYALVHSYRLIRSLNNDRTIILIEHFSHYIYQMSFAMNFYIYIVFGSKFRREFRRFIWKCRVFLFEKFEKKDPFKKYEEPQIRTTSSSNSQPIFITERNRSKPKETWK